MANYTQWERNNDIKRTREHGWRKEQGIENNTGGKNRRTTEYRVGKPWTRHDGQEEGVLLKKWLVASALCQAAQVPTSLLSIVYGATLICSHVDSRGRDGNNAEPFMPYIRNISIPDAQRSLIRKNISCLLKLISLHNNWTHTASEMCLHKAFTGF